MSSNLADLCEDNFESKLSDCVKKLTQVRLKNLLRILVWSKYKRISALMRSQPTIAIQARTAQLVVYRLGIGEVLGSNPGKGDNFLWE